jgi:hypothetical protein
MQLCLIESFRMIFSGRQCLLQHAEPWLDLSARTQASASRESR